MRALVTGAAGFLGSALVRALVARGDSVRALVRRAAPELEGIPGVEPVVGDATDARSLAAAVRGVDAVFHLAGVRRATDAAEFLRVNAGSTRLALDACLAGAPALRRFVLAGSLAAAGPSAAPLREDAPLRPVEAYGTSKAEAERIALSYADRLPVTVARPPRIVGPGDRENLILFRIARRGLVPRLGGPERPLSWIDVDDCARGLLLLADHPDAVGEPFFLASPEPTTLEGLLAEAARSLGVPAREVPLPAALLRWAAAVADLVTTATGRRLPLNRKLATQALAPGWRCDPGKARTLLGFEASTPLSASVAAASGWYRAHGWL